MGGAKLGAFLGTFLGGALMLYYGRRVAIAVDAAFFAVGPLIMAAAFNVPVLVLGRVVVGIGIGVSAVAVPAYLGEVSPPAVRGRVVELYELLLCAGMLAAALVDAALEGAPGGWRLMVGLPAAPALLLLRERSGWGLASWLWRDGDLPDSCGGMVACAVHLGWLCLGWAAAGGRATGCGSAARRGALP